MSSIADSAVLIQTSCVSIPAPPSCFGEAVLIAAHLRQHGVLSKITEQVRFVRRRFGHYEADLLSRPLTNEKQTGNLVDRAGSEWLVFDLDGTREAARQRALPQTEELPPPFRRLDEVCAPGYTGRKRGQVVRTRTVISQAHRSQWLCSFGNRGNGRYREELRQGLSALSRYLTAQQFPPAHTLLRLDGQFGTGAVLAELAGLAFVTRGKDYSVLDHPLVQARLHFPPDQLQQREDKSDGT